MDLEDPDPPKLLAHVKLDQLVEAFAKVAERAEANKHMIVTRETLSLRERMTSVLSKLKNTGHIRFEELFTLAEGRLGVVVTFIALLELCRDDMIVISQTEPYAPIHIKQAA